MVFSGVSNQEKENLKTEQMGAFSGYIRRPQPSVSGMTAQIFGEDGEDADTISALSLSKYKDAQVQVNIYLIKDANGKIMKKNDEYPLISSFIGFIRRPKPNEHGMIAQFFATNGIDADGVSNLSKSDYQDCLVFVDVKGIKADNNTETELATYQEINQRYLHKMTKIEREVLIKKEKAYKKMNELLEVHDFLTRIEVISSINNFEQYKSWLLENQGCSHLQEKVCMNQADIIEIPGLIKPYNYLPICHHHKEDLNNPIYMEDNKLYYEMKHRLILKQWVWNNFKEKFSPDGKSEPNPEKIIEWAASKNLTKYLPAKYQQVLS